MSMPAGTSARIGEAEALLRRAAAQDALLLARLHGRELDAPALARLREGPFAGLFALVPEEEAARQACLVIDEGWRALAADEGDEEAMLRELAADYAATYLTFRHRVPVTESVCLDEDHLQRQQPMMQVREWYRRFGVAAPDWRKMADDHIAPQIAFIAHLLAGAEAGEGAGSLADVAAFMDGHILRWVDEFAAAAGSRCDTPFYAGLGMFTACWLKNLRRALALLGAPRAEQAEAAR
jgi:TorA maturation chaperone TorD